MRTYDFLKDYFNEDENFIIAKKIKSNNGKSFNTHHMFNMKEEEKLKKFLGHCFYKNSDSITDIYFTLNTYKSQPSKSIKRKEEFVESIKSFYFDIDKEVDVIYPQIISLFGKPTYKITSSKGKYQLIYKFTEPYQGDFIYFKQLLKGVVYHLHPIDKLFDIARIFRLAGFKNKKPSNNDFLVEVEKFENYYTFEKFEKITKPFLLPDVVKKTNLKPSKTVLKQKSSHKTAITSDVNKYEKYSHISKKINKKYKELLEKYHNDKSTADIAYIKWLRTAKQINEKNELILKLFEARGYTDLVEKHGYQLDYYITNILEKTLTF